MALEDPWGAPFNNPAKGVLLSQSSVFSLPCFYSITNNFGKTKTFPVGAVLTSKDLFAGFAASVQEVSTENPNSWSTTLNDRSSSNILMTGFLGTRLPNRKTSLGIGFYWADLEAIDGVQLLYVNSQSIEQYGEVKSFTAGLYHQFENGQNLDMQVSFQSTDMTHDVQYRDWNFIEDFDSWGWDERREKNRDKTDLWGIHMVYKRPLLQNGWTLAALLTANWKSHPKIPNYDIMNIPRDPGNSQAYNLGFGLAKETGSSIFGFDMVYEPIRSHTWADAAENIERGDGTILYAGEKTVDNRFRFSNLWMHMGISRKTRKVDWQFGLKMQTIRYRLNQENYVEKTDRTQHESWFEWTWTWGVLIHAGDFDLAYHGSVLTGNGLPGIDMWGNEDTFTAARMQNDVLLAPSGALTLQDASVFTHRFSVMIPIG
jgi:hypothetical protein